MKIRDRIFGKLSKRSLCTMILMIGAFLLVHGFLKRLAVGGHLLECLSGIVISGIAIFIAAIPPSKLDFPITTSNLMMERNAPVD